MKPHQLVVACVLFAQVTLVAADDSTQQEPPRIAVPLPDCGEALCVIPKLYWESWKEQRKEESAEIARLRKELAGLRASAPTKKCATVERLS
jgi:hypothetical protein